MHIISIQNTFILHCACFYFFLQRIFQLYTFSIQLMKYEEKKKRQLLLFNASMTKPHLAQIIVK